MNANFQLPAVKNEPVLTYAPDTAERKNVKAALQAFKNVETDVPMIINGKEVRTDDKIRLSPPHEHAHTLGYAHRGTTQHVHDAINAALAAKHAWENTPFEARAAIFLKAADLLAGPYRARMNAATMLSQSKNAFQAEIDAACEFIDFLRYNCNFAAQIYAQQPESQPGMWNRMEYRALEGFVLAVTPFNFTAIAGNLCAAPALMGNTIVWKCSDTQIFSAKVIMDLFVEAGLPAGVINLVFTDGPLVGEVCFAHPDFTGLHFTGSTGTFQKMWQSIGANIATYKTYPRIVGETGGKDFIVAHPSADAKALSVAMVRGAFEYQGQKCSAASRAYVPKTLWKTVWKNMEADMKTIKTGTVEDFSNYVNAVIDERSFDKIASYIAKAKAADDAEIIFGGGCDKSNGYFVEPTVILTTNPNFVTLCEEIFGPVLTIYVYADKDFDKTLDLVDSTSPYALTGAIFAQDRYAVEQMSARLRHSAGNFYINDKPTGAVVGQQPFGGARASGTNDKAGSYLNLLRWVSARTIKETLVPPHDYRYPFLLEA
jgi:1-pyrroline-5-carboxylate dehydrogenase